MVLQKLKIYRKDTQGNFVIIFAALMVVILLGIAIAVNTIEMHTKKRQLGDAADAAILAAVNSVERIAQSNSAKDSEEALILGNSVFEKNVADITGIGEVEYDIKLKMGAGNREVIGKLTYKTEKPSFLAGILGRDEIVISETVKASKSFVRYARINFLIDVSSSMGIGADDANQQLMSAATGCTVACHTNGSLTVARNANIRLRIDTVKDAVTHMVQQLKDIRQNRNEFEVALYTFSNSVEQHLEPTVYLNNVLSSIDDIEISTENLQWGTNIQYSLEQLNELIPLSQDGLNRGSRQSFVVVLTDGVENSRQRYSLTPTSEAQRLDPNFEPFAPIHGTGDERIQGFNPENCRDIKNSGHTLAFLNPTYLIPQNATDPGRIGADKYKFIEDMLMSDIKTHSEQCASNINFAYSAETEAQVEQATSDLFNDLMASNVRLTK